MFEDYYRALAAANTPLSYSVVHPKLKWRPQNKAALLILSIIVIFIGLQIREFMKDHAQYQIVGSALRHAAEIRTALTEYWMTYNAFPLSNEEIGLSAPEGGWSEFKRVTVTPDGRTVFEYQRQPDSGVEPFILVMALKPSADLTRLRHTCGGSDLRQKNIKRLTEFCEWDETLSTQAPTQVAGMTREKQARQIKAELALEPVTFDTNYTPLMAAASRSDGAEIRRLLLTPGTTVNAVDAEGNSALMYACRRHSLDIVDLLLAAKADAVAKNNAGLSAAFWLVRDPAPEDGVTQAILEKLLLHGVTLGQTDSHGATLLHYAATNDNLPLAQFLLDRGAMLEASDFDGRTPLMRAALSRSGDRVLRHLMNLGAQINVMDKSGRTATQLVQTQSSGAEAEKRYLMLRAAGGR